MTVHVPEPTVVAAAELAPVRTTCPYCGVGCGVLATPDGLGGVSIAGDPDHPSNFGRLCSKGAALGETVGLERRLLHPMIAGRRASWDDALTAVADGFARIVAEHGPDAVAFYLSGQLLTEDYYVANKLMKGFLGSSHVDTNSRLCMASSVAGHRRAFGSDTVPGCYEDLDERRSPRAGRLECGLVPPRPVPAHAGQSPDARRAHRGDRSAQDRRPATRPTCSSPSLRARTPPCSAGFSSISPRPARSTAPSSTGTRRDSATRWRKRARSRPTSRRPPRRLGSPPGRSRLSSICSGRSRRSSRSTARASTSPRRAPTRSAPSSIAISPPGASAAPVSARSR